MEVVQDICRESGDEFFNIEYERFNELKILDKPLNNNSDYKSNIRPGDCVVAFGKNDIFAIRKEVRMGNIGNFVPKLHAGACKE